MNHFIEKKYSIVLFGVLMMFMGVLLICRAFYGMDLTDETFYLATARRFCDGDMLFKNDWNAGQLFGLLMVPVYQLYVSFHGNSEGVILFVRICFVFLEIFVSCFLFRTILYYAKSYCAAVFSALCVLLYVRGNIITISYYSLGFHTFLLSVLWWMESERSNKKIICFILSGINFAISTICMPYMIIPFTCLFIMGIYYKLSGNEKKVEQILWWIAGIMSTAMFFLVYFYKWIPWSHILEYISYVFLDPTLESSGVFEQCLDLAVYYVFYFLKYTWPVYLLTLVLAYLIGKKRIRHPSIIKCFLWILWMEFIMQSIYVRSYFEGGIIVTFFLLALQIQLTDPQNRCKLLEHYFIIPGLCFGGVWILGSNVGERVMNMSFLFMDIWAICFFINISCKYGKFAKTIMQLPVYLLVCVLFVIRFFDIYRDGSLWNLKYQISSGCMKGIYTEENRGKLYEKTVEMLHINVTNDDVIVVIGCNPWIYIDVSGKCGAYTTWNIADGEELLSIYYEKNPEKIPSVIINVSKELGVYESWKYSSHGNGLHEPKELKIGILLSEIIEEGKYRCIEKMGNVIYRK